MNSIDMAGLIDALKISGNEKAELVTTHGRRENTNESPYTWEIVNNRELMDWFISQIESESSSKSE